MRGGAWRFQIEIAEVSMGDDLSPSLHWSTAVLMKELMTHTFAQLQLLYPSNTHTCAESFSQLHITR